MAVKVRQGIFCMQLAQDGHRFTDAKLNGSTSTLQGT